MKLKVIEPLKMLFKDEVRRIGKSLLINDQLLQRHPFPGPSIAIRILGDVRVERVKILQDVDDIFEILETVIDKYYAKIEKAKSKQPTPDW